MTVHWEQAYAPGQRLRALLMSVEFGTGYLDQLAAMIPAESHPDDAVVLDLQRALIDAVRAAELQAGLGLKVIKGGRPDRQNGQGRFSKGAE